MSEAFPYSFGKYRMEAEIGRGGFGTVFRAEDVDLGRTVAIKVLDPLYMRDGRWVARFRREARMMASLDHPHIVPIYDISEEEGRLYIAMKYIDGPELADQIAEEGGLPLDRVVAIVEQIASALDYAHQRDIIHRDIKPANILISNGQAMLTDFGLAQIVSSNSLSASVSGGVTGTYNYIPPEVFNDEAVTPASDVYALGCVLYEMLTGQVLVDGTTPAAVMMSHVKGITLDKPLPAGTPPGTREILSTALALDPLDRYASAGDLAQALQSVTDESLVPPPAAEKTGLPGWVWWAGALVILVAIILGIRTIFFNGEDTKPAVVEVTRLVVETEQIEVTVEIEPPEEVTTVASELVAEETSSADEVEQVNPAVEETPEPTSTPTITPSPIPSSEPNLPPSDPTKSSVWQRPQDQMNMVYVPSGSFMMGSEDGEDDEKPVHEVTLDGFWIDEKEVTNSQFANFLNEKGNQVEGDNNWLNMENGRIDENNGEFLTLSGISEHPVVNVTWYGADAYCEWVGGQLPSEAQWEFAARGTESKRYPWGNEEPTCDQAQFRGCGDGTVSVGSFANGASWVGSYDLAGNASEWVNDIYNETYYENSPSNKPLGPVDGKSKTNRGGSWYDDLVDLRSANRDVLGPEGSHDVLGFRCAMPSSETSSPSTNNEAAIPTPSWTPIATPDSDQPPTDAALGSVWQRPQDNMNMVYVPAGTFLMGSEDGFDNEKPVHEVTLDGFWIDQTEVTNSQYADFLNETGIRNKSSEASWFKEQNGRIMVEPEYAEYPVQSVSWDDASAYCDWAEGQVPSEAEWEYAARGPESRRYPWGDKDPTCNLAQFIDCDGLDVPVGSFTDGESWIGALDMAGNMAEWVSDWYYRLYYTYSPTNNPQGPESGTHKVYRGGSFLTDNLRSSIRNSYSPAGPGSVGIRCSLPEK